MILQSRHGAMMFYVYDLPKIQQRSTITIDPAALKLDTSRTTSADIGDASADYAEDDIDFVDDAFLNTAPHNKIEQQLLRGDVVGLALMSGAILWSAMGAFG